MSERRRRTMGERGAPPDPLNAGLYCRHCQSKYCSCDGLGNQEDRSWEYDLPPGDPWADDAWGEASAASKPPEPPEPPKESESDDGWLALGMGAAGVAVVAGVAGAIFGLSAAIGVVGAGVAAVVGVAVFGDDEDS